MYEKIMVPVDLAHVDRLEKALTTAADLARHYRIPICYVGVTTSLPGAVAHTPAEFARKLEQFGADWPRVKTIMAELARHGVHLADVKPGNISFR